MEPAKDPNDLIQGDKKLEFRYDYMGRRVEKKVYTHNGSSWDLSTTRRFMYYNWLPLLDVTNPGDPNETITILRKYTWGLDLAGLVGSVGVSPVLDAAGGIGGHPMDVSVQPGAREAGELHRIVTHGNAVGR